MENLNTIQEKRQYLKNLSSQVRDLVEAGEYNNVNEAILNQFYRNETHKEFKTFHQWKKEGKKVKKGERAFVLWGKPKPGQQKEEEETKPEPDEDEDEETEEELFYPVAYIFSNSQVHERASAYNLTASEVSINYKPKLKSSEMPKITGSKDAYELLLPIWTGLEHLEKFYVLLLNRANKVLGYAHISTGGVAGTMVDPKIILQLAIKCNASGIILAHNHPSGNLEPSASDKALTTKIKNGASFLDVNVLDHIILTSEGYTSFADEGIM